ncbi:very short patch repair endonuclease [Brevibacterium aurantiacum]|uniref:very short patch repair endonuclease n=1 Tax=Brevibacterium aurantiacum TaxID=273384 RepID=UPI000C765DF2|nr:very short patch repair endonuclease [Brevibacterium aurantiacum]
MSRQKAKNIAPKVELRRELRRLGLGYRIQLPLPGMPRRRCDVGFIGAQVAVFVNGCFWHTCRVHATVPSQNRDWLIDKLAANVTRDHESEERLSAASWLSIRVWEHEDMATAVSRIDEVVRRRRR